MESKFDINKVIIDSTKLIEGKQYYFADYLEDLRHMVESNNIFNILTYKKEPFNDILTYQFWYPKETDDEDLYHYEPYNLKELSDEEINSWIGKTFKLRDSDEKSHIIYKITHVDKEKDMISYDRIIIMPGWMSPTGFLRDFEWDKKKYCGVKVKNN